MAKIHVIDIAAHIHVLCQKFTGHIGYQTLMIEIVWLVPIPKVRNLKLCYASALTLSVPHNPNCIHCTFCGLCPCTFRN